MSDKTDTETTCATCRCEVEVERDSRYYHSRKEPCGAPTAPICPDHLRAERAEHLQHLQDRDDAIARLKNQLCDLVDAVDREQEARVEVTTKLRAARRIELQRNDSYAALIAGRSA